MNYYPRRKKNDYTIKDLRWTIVVYCHVGSLGHIHKKISESGLAFTEIYPRATVLTSLNMWWIGNSVSPYCFFANMDGGKLHILEEFNYFIYLVMDLTIEYFTDCLHCHTVSWIQFYEHTSSRTWKLAERCPGKASPQSCCYGADPNTVCRTPRETSPMV